MNRPETILSMFEGRFKSLALVEKLCYNYCTATFGEAGPTPLKRAISRLIKERTKR